MRFITPIFFILVSIGIFFGYINPSYTAIRTDKLVEKQYDEALSQSKELLGVRDDLLSEYNKLDSSDLVRLKKLVPDNIDNVRLIMEIDGMAKRRGINVRNIIVRVDGPSANTTESKKTLVVSTKEYESVILEFSFAASYENFKDFLGDLEESLRLVDINSVNFISSNDGFNEYKIAVRTYWLK